MLVIGNKSIKNMNFIRKLLSHNWIAIFYFNFKLLPFAQAIHLPFDFYYDVRFENLTGKVSLDADAIKRGMIKFGGRGSEMFSRCTTIIDLRGTIVFHGVTEIGHGCLLRVDDGANITFGHEVRIGALTKIFCRDAISFGNEIDFSWECQIFDSNFHYVRDIKTNEIEKITSPINIGSYNWFGNRVTVMKGTVTPDHFICASNSLCNRNYTDLVQYSVVGGYPVRTLAINKQRIFENSEDVSKLNISSRIDPDKL